ncbi:MAG: hypothetical protein Q4C30_05755 [Bacteroidia bacterium]|nr:hypothetical protein [Bacteroidia bacterium]
MKSIISAIAVIALTMMMFSCNIVTERERQLQDSLAMLQSIMSFKDSVQKDYDNTLKSIQDNIAAIKEREKLLSTADYEGGRAPKEEIEADIAMINNLLQENKKKVAELTARLKKANIDNKDFEYKMQMLQEQLAMQNAEVDKLTALLQSKDIEIAQWKELNSKLANSVDSVSRVASVAFDDIAKLTDDKNTAYYVVGTKSDLKAKGITESTGLFSKKLSGDVDNSYFTKVNWTEVTSIPTHSKRIKLITSHDANSYIEEKDSEGYITIHIKDKESFWKLSKFLVIQGRGIDEE